jgi:hypothetical protein
MPRLEIRKPNEVPAPSRSSRAVQEQQQVYESFIREIDGNVGELQLSPDENMRSVKVRLRRAATRVGSEIEIWDADGRVYFRATTARRRGRPPKNA